MAAAWLRTGSLSTLSAPNVATMMRTVGPLGETSSPSASATNA